MSYPGEKWICPNNETFGIESGVGVLFLTTQKHLKGDINKGLLHGLSVCKANDCRRGSWKGFGSIQIGKLILTHAHRGC